MKSRFFLLAFAVLSWTNCLSQINDFRFRRKITAIDSPGWYSLTLPNGIYKNLKKDFSDLRIYQFNEKDTVESPYVLQIHHQEITEETVHVNVFNQSKKEGKQFVTFELPKGYQVNLLDLSFNETNFDGFVRLEGSNDQKEWFEIEKHQRIISIENQNINFHSSTIYFSAQSFRYMRIQIDANKTLSLKEASVKKRIIKPATLEAEELKWTIDANKKKKQTVINIDLENFLPIVDLKIEVNEETDYYRPFHLEKLSDSTNTPKGWQHFYETILQGYLTSLDSNHFIFDYTLANKLRLIVDDGDNQPLNFKNIAIFSPKIEMIARMNEGVHYLYYGNSRAIAPTYDLVHFKDKIPSQAASLNLDEEEKLIMAVPPVSPLIKNKLWLWILMGLIIAVLAFFTMKMMKEK